MILALLTGSITITSMEICSDTSIADWPYCDHLFGYLFRY